jgi:ribosomal protein S18 acetylase RimI-like enzyme
MHAHITDTATRQRLTRPVVQANDPTVTAPTVPASAGLPPTVRIRRAQPADAHDLAALVADALHPLALSAWLVPDPVQRRRVFTDVAAIHVEHALTDGQAWITSDRTAAALWLPHDEGQPIRPDDYEQRLNAACGPTVERFRTLDQTSARSHAVEPHHQHLAVLAVHPDRRRHGLGKHVLVHQHLILDAAGVPACATATDPASRALYLSLGYADRRTPLDLPDGPKLWPMWRTPRSHRRSAPPTRSPAPR